MSRKSLVQANISCLLSNESNDFYGEINFTRQDVYKKCVF